MKIFIVLVQYYKNPVFTVCYKFLYFTFSNTVYLMKYFMSYIVHIMCIQFACML